MLKEFVNKKIELFLLGVFSLITSLLVLPNVFTKNDLTSWDFVGHIFTSEFAKDSLYPNIMGWNPFHSLGYPQGSFYPSLIHYLIGFLDYIYNDTEFWVKFLFAAALIALPFTIYFFASKVKNKLKSDHLRRDKLALVAIAQLTTILIIFAPQLYGGSVKSFLQIGLLSNFLTLPVLFYYLGLIMTLDYEDLLSKKNFLASLLLSFLLLSHLVNGPIALLFTLGFWVLGFFNKDAYLGKKIFSSYFIVLAISFLSSAFFFLPYIRNSYLISPIKNTIQFSKYSIFFCFAVFVINFGLIKLVKPVSKRAFLLLNAVILFLISIAVLESVLIYMHSDFNVGVAQPYRIFSVTIFLGFAFFLTGLWVVLSEEKRQFLSILKSEKALTILQLPIILVLAFGLFRFDIGTKDYGNLELNQPNISAMRGNVLSLITLDDTYYLYRDPIYTPLEINKNIFFLNTQFNESSYLNAFTSALRDNIYDSGAKAREIKKEYPETYQLSQEKIYFFLDLFNIKYLVFSDLSKVKYDLCKDTFEYARLNPEGKTLYACETKIPSYTADDFLISSNSDWNKEMFQYSTTTGNYNVVEDFGFEDRIASIPTANYKGDINWSPNYQSFSIDNSNSILLTILPIQYNPRWHAFLTKEDGSQEEVATYRISPNLIGVLNKGKIEFKYQFSISDRILKYSAYTTVTLNVIVILFGSYLIPLFQRKAQTK